MGIARKRGTMKNKKPKDTLLQAVSDLYIRDIEKLLFVNKDYKKAGLVMSAIGMSKNMINKYIKEAKEVN
jgi:hypothetical protein